MLRAGKKETDTHLKPEMEDESIKLTRREQGRRDGKPGGVSEK